MGDVPPAVRLLPMSLKEFLGELTSLEEFRQLEQLPPRLEEDRLLRILRELQEKYFLDDLPHRETCNFLHRKIGMDAERGSIVLFQCRARVIAVAEFVDRKQFDSVDEDGFSGELYFDETSIGVFDPVGADFVRKFWSEFKGFNQTQQKLDPKHYLEFEQELEGKRGPRRWMSGS